MREFTGFTPGTASFFRDLAEHNERGWWRANSDRYERDVAEPTDLLVAELEPLFGPAHRFRPYRDVRFSPDKRPYQEHVSFAIDRPGGLLYAQIGAADVTVAGGRWQPSSAELGAFRRLIDDPRSAEDVEQQLAERARAGLTPDDEAVLKTAPRGYPRDHPRLDLLRRKRLSVSARLPVGPWLQRREALDRIAELWRSADAWNAWLFSAVPAQPAEEGERGPRRA